VSDSTHTYDAANIELLEGVEAVRKRPGMYVGSTGERGLRIMVFALIHRAVSEFLVGRANSVDVTLTPDGGVRIDYDGPGVPFEAAGATEGPGLETLLTRGGPDLGGRHTVAEPVVGMDFLIVNALSSSLTAEVRRDGVRWVQEYAYGVPVTAPVQAGPATGNGTTIGFLPDTGVFEAAAVYSFPAMAQRLMELAFLNRGLAVSLTDERVPGEPAVARFRFPDGVRDFVAFIDAGLPLPGSLIPEDVVGFEHEDARMGGTLELALRWRGTSGERIHGYANSRLTPEGGTHVEGFREGLAAAIDACARRRGVLSAADPAWGADLVAQGLTAVVSVKLDRPEFLGATRGGLGDATVRTCVAEAVRDRFGAWLAEHPEQAAEIIARTARTTRD
jgi:DNA gyrase subunit B